MQLAGLDQAAFDLKQDQCEKRAAHNISGVHGIEGRWRLEPSSVYTLDGY